jgi:hypothetical protein
MKQAAPRNLSAFTIIEMLIIITVLMVLAVMLLPALRRPHVGGGPSCFSNLKEIGVAYRMWAGDNGDMVPAQQAVSKGGWKELLNNPDQGPICWTNYVIMSNEFGQNSIGLVCRSDDRLPVSSFTNIFDNTHISYFVGVSARENDPQSILAGDRNLGPGNKPDPDYGFSPKNGKGNDVAVPISRPVSWSLKMHSRGNPPSGAGNVLLGDGSAQQTSTASFNVDWLRKADPTTNWPAGHVPATPSIRLLFP